jgi:hypothetical protein
MNKHLRWAAVAAVLVAVPALAQDSMSDMVRRITEAGRLPTVTKESRQLGVPESDLQGIFRAAHDNQISTTNLVDIFTVENEAIRQNGRIDNFGSFVQGRLAAGLRGRDLANAIHAEHARRGMGKGSNPGMSGEHGKSGNMGNSGDMGKSGEAGKSGEHGKSGEAGKSGEHGKSGEAGNKNGGK